MKRVTSPEDIRRYGAIRWGGSIRCQFRRHPDVSRAQGSRCRRHFGFPYDMPFSCLLSTTQSILKSTVSTHPFAQLGTISVGSRFDGTETADIVDGDAPPSPIREPFQSFDDSPGFFFGMCGHYRGMCRSQEPQIVTNIPLQYESDDATSANRSFDANEIENLFRLSDDGLCVPSGIRTAQAHAGGWDTASFQSCRRSSHMPRRRVAPFAIAVRSPIHTDRSTRAFEKGVCDLFPPVSHDRQLFLGARQASLDEPSRRPFEVRFLAEPRFRDDTCRREEMDVNVSPIATVSGAVNREVDHYPVPLCEPLSKLARGRQPLLIGQFEGQGYFELAGDPCVPAALCGFRFVPQFLSIQRSLRRQRLRQYDFRVNHILSKAIVVNRSAAPVDQPSARSVCGCGNPVSIVSATNWAHAEMVDCQFCRLHE